MLLEFSNDSVPAILDGLTNLAWRKPVVDSGESPFLLAPPRVGMLTSEQALWQAVRKMYDHARVWAPGFDIPCFIPPVRIAVLQREAGFFSLDEESYASIGLSSSFLSSSDATLLILAHEACHHILLQTGISYGFKNDTNLNERVTDLTMFVCGFGEIARRGYSAVCHDRNRFISVHLGYLEPFEYRQAYDFVLNKRQRLHLPGVARRLSLMNEISAWAQKAFISRKPGKQEGTLLDRVVEETERQRRR